MPNCALDRGFERTILLPLLALSFPSSLTHAKHLFLLFPNMLMHGEYYLRRGQTIVRALDQAAPRDEQTTIDGTATEEAASSR